MKRKCGKWGEKLRAHGYKCTSTREEILGVLESTDGHPSPEEVYHEVYNNLPNIGLTTVYRTLELLVKLGIVVKFDFGDGRSRFEFSEAYSSKPHHHHLICRMCGDVIDYSDFMDEEVSYLGKIEKALGEKHDFEIKTHLIHFYGICSKCR